MALLWSLTKNTNRPLHPDLVDVWNWPSTVTYLVSLRMKYDSFLELPEVPPEEHWDFPVIIQRHIEKVYPHMKKSTVEISVDDVEG